MSSDLIDWGSGEYCAGLANFGCMNQRIFEQYVTVLEVYALICVISCKIEVVIFLHLWSYITTQARKPAILTDETGKKTS